MSCYLSCYLFGILQCHLGGRREKGLLPDVVNSYTGAPSPAIILIDKGASVTRMAAKRPTTGIVSNTLNLASTGSVGQIASALKNDGQGPHGEASEK